MLADVSGKLIISASDVRGEIVFYLRHRASINRDGNKRARTNVDKADYIGRALELERIADELEAAKIV